MDLHVSFIDLLVVGVILVSAGYATWRGLVSETLSIFAWAAAAFVTLWFGPSVTPLARNLVSPPILASLVAYAVVFLAVLIPLSFLSFRFSQTVKGSMAGPLDRALGAAFGVVRGLAIVGFAYLILESFVKFDDQPESVRNARTLPLMQAATEVILSLAPSREPRGTHANPPARAEVTQQPEPKPQPHATTAKKRKSRSMAIMPSPKPGTTATAAKTTTAGTATKPSKKRQKTYGDHDRRALDNLIETTGGNSTP